MTNDFFFIFYWWLLIFGLGIIFLPLTCSFFQKFFDKGYAFSKIIGILIISYTTWLLGSLKILPFLNEAIWLVILAAITGNYWLLRRQEGNFKREIKKNWKIFLSEEILFFTALAFWSSIRGFQPNIQGLEKFMDYGFVNSILRSKYFPPADMWLAGETINYYYFGHLVSAVLTKLSGVNSAITYNLMIATLFALCFTAAFSLGGNLIYVTELKSLQKHNAYALPIRNFYGLNRKVVIAGVASAFLLTLSANLHPLWWFSTHGNFKGYWYPDATRLIVQKFGAADNTIHEFPLYSFVVADLHGHLINLPFVLLFLALVLALLNSKKISLFRCFIVSLLLGTFYMTNAWDLPIYLLVLGLATLWFNYLKQSEKQGSPTKVGGSYLNYGKTLKTLIKTALFIILYSSFFILLSLPFHLNFQSIAQGVALVDFHTPVWMLLVLWGFPLLATLSFLAFFFSKKTKRHPIDSFILILLATSWFLILMPEVFYVKDIYIHSHQRANTMFKLTYQSFVMFSLAGGYIIIQVLTNLKQTFLKLTWAIFIFSFLIFVLIYPCFAIQSYYGLKVYQGLYGLNYLKRDYPDDYQAILWLQKNISGQPVIVEAVGESYTDFARVSTNTGLPTILGWRVHEWLWRGSFDEPGKRTEEVKTIYESSDLAKTKLLLTKYRVWLIFVGSLERQQYPNLQEEKFNQLGEVIFSSGVTKVYRLNSTLSI